MSSAICTIFEGHYHFGVAALANSLYTQGFRGALYAGYRGEIPRWASSAKQNNVLDWPGNSTLEVAPGLELHFLPLNTDYHLTNFKPDFMLTLWQSVAGEAEAMFYFDPDIVVTTPWSLFEEWITCGIALCEDINSPLAQYHPMRVAWRRYFEPKGFSLKFKEAIYANGGFIGVSIKNRGFISRWQMLQEAMAPAIGGLNRSSFTALNYPLPFDPFGKTDQDALNATVEACENEIFSFVGQEGMSFKPGVPLMSHALGKNKPWLSQYLIQAINGQSPRTVDRDYWQASKGPILLYSPSLIRAKIIAIKIAALIGRFYRIK